jgi:2-alkenal reductase
MDQAVAEKPLMRPWVGVYYEPVTPALVDRLDLPVDYGVLVQAPGDDQASGVMPDSPAAAAGLRDGDVITAINDERLDVAHPFDMLLAQYGPEEVLTLSVLRADGMHTVRLVLGTRPAQL